MLTFRGRYLKTGRGTLNLKVHFRVILGVVKIIINLVFTESHYFDVFFAFQIFFDLERICVLSRQGPHRQ